MNWMMIGTIAVINIVYVSLFTVRLIFVMKNYRSLAAAISMVEVFVYLMGLNIVLDNIDEPINLAAYCIGFGLGVFLGSKIEEWLALGYVTAQIVVDSESSKLPAALRERGFGVTSWLADGRDGHRLVMQVLAKRSHEKKLIATVNEIAPKAFYISYEPRFFKGGFWTRRLR
ncbi:DUF2179 domain-containing protein [Marinicrinis lubricantis]|uniref:UPF0316 protein ACFPXP_01750 n=1 Tax=Marinicrinis lubricantis TaxID=2086470 RepID=A0ABW1IJH6_9BACL